MKTRFAIRDKICVITGAAGALCGVIASEFARAGARVALLDIDEEALERRREGIEHDGGCAMAVVCDVLDASSIDSAAERIDETWGVADVLINGAGGNQPGGSTTVDTVNPDALKGAATENVTSFFDLTGEGLKSVFGLNLFGTVLPTKRFARSMALVGRGSIINFSSMSALTPLTRVGGYSAAKAAVANFTQWLAVHLAPVGIRANALAPGFFMTEQLRFLHIDQATGKQTERAKKVIEHTPMRRYGEPEELVGVSIWLASDDSSFVTGALIPIDGGFSSYSI